jgi:hypothetical protein
MVVGTNSVGEDVGVSRSGNPMIDAMETGTNSVGAGVGVDVGVLVMGGGGLIIPPIPIKSDMLSTGGPALRISSIVCAEGDAVGCAVGDGVGECVG